VRNGVAHPTAVFRLQPLPSLQPMARRRFADILLTRQTIGRRALATPF
jgi:hypothetical protein